MKVSIAVPFTGDGSFMCFSSVNNIPITRPPGADPLHHTEIGTYDMVRQTFRLAMD